MDYRSEIQYRGVMNYRTGYRHRCGTKSALEHAMDYEDALKRISQLPVSERKAALREWKRGYVR